MSTYALIVGGGTAGHVLPGVAIGAELVHRGHDPATIHFVGSERGVERTIVPEAGFDQTLLPGRGIQRRFTRDNIGAIRGLIDAFGQAKTLVDDREPAVVVALGGYASVPAGLWAAIRRIPIVVAEQNAVPGLANKLIGRFAKACAVSFEGTELPRATWTGNPVRPEILAVGADAAAARDRARSELGLAAGTKLVVVFGGSLGARTINNATIDALDLLKDRQDVHIRHIIGTRDFADITSKAAKRLDGPLTYTPIEYEHDMASIFAAADLVVCRAGATSCAELAVTGTPSVLIPLPGAPGDHQTANARALERVGGAELVPDSLVDGPLVARTVERLLEDPETLADMRLDARSIARPDAASAVADLVERFGGSHG
ncbi:MAG: undecaprenyldiphospho-muramoylpentapeptide beta-N-acetylglucosaminyltransferase [Acidimicrobiales bacterium]|nr:undecaprenyldiphospho-muramoylpentapeptide beta-N-acetylglucosaminyltransferase [Acidimicrobiales bacterium]RZV45043.1 MAG: undecaprenyldiphospho-muramoylpentapeptide beta-N-acetylglucosaminyltransferase [Acidimicrobiales bacterium]